MVQKNFLYILKPPVMKKSFLKKIVPHIPAAIAITCLIIYGSFRQTEDKPSPEVAAKQCCSGYTVPMPNLKQFMLDSLQGIQFEGGVYNKASLIAAINATPGTSVYLLNLLPNCNISKTSFRLLANGLNGGPEEFLSTERPRPICRLSTTTAQKKSIDAAPAS